MFKILLRIALASLHRRLARSLLVMVMIAMSLWGLLAMEGLYDGMTEQVIDNAIRSDSGDISIYGQGFRLDPGLQHLIHNPAGVSALLAADPRVRSHVRRLRQDGLIATAHYSRNATLMAVDLAAEDRHGRLASYLAEGDYAFGDKGRGALVGYRLADKMKLKVGDKIVLSAQNSSNEVAALALRITGILKTNNMALDDSAVYMDLAQGRNMLMVPEGVSQISVLLHERREVMAVKQALQAELAHLDVRSWDELYPA
ncbi:MAG: ABC transporter permease, partial [Desulfurivibrionaceae bacterium]|nr:ABC transporter permease [Desulfurivibrionaceae bacterium]